jgi:hypothetical protein
MILGMSAGAFTILHVVITLVAIGSGFIVVGGMFASDRLPVTTALFLFTTALTSVTGFLFPIHGFTPALGVGIVACVILAIALFALYKEHLAGAWRWIYVITADPPPLKWSDSEYGFWLEEDQEWEGRDTSLKRSSPSCARLMC